MSPEERQQFEQLLRDVADLKRNADQRKTQQIQYPLDPASRTVVDEDNLVAIGRVVSGSPTTNGHIVVSINGSLYKVMTTA